MTPFEEDVLGRVSEDYEAARTIRGDIERDLKRPVSEAEVLRALLDLAHGGFVQAYIYEATENRYRAISPSEAEQAQEPWFLSMTKVQFDETRERIREIEKRALEKLRGRDDKSK
jgi:hypothetical protein